MEQTSGFRNFNIAGVGFYFLTSAFMLIFISFLDAALVTFYIFYFILAVINTVFHCIRESTQIKWVINRKYLIYIPFLIMNIFYLVSFVKFFGQLEHYNEQYNQLAEVPKQDQVRVSSFVTIYFILYIMAPFF